MSDTVEIFNPEYNPNGAEGSLDTNKLPWICLLYTSPSPRDRG